METFSKTPMAKRTPGETPACRPRPRNFLVRQTRRLRKKNSNPRSRLSREASVGVGPLDDPVDRETGRVFKRLAEPGSPVTLSGGERLFAVERCSDRVHDGGDAHRLLDRFLRDAGVLQRVVMRLDAGAAAVDR